MIMIINKHKILILISSFQIINGLTDFRTYAQSKVGTSAATFLGMPVGMKATAMGGAFIAIVDDPSALYWNPGAISRNAQTMLYASQSNYLVGSTHNWIGLQLAVTGQNAIGISVNQLDYGVREKVTTVALPEGTGEFWEASDLCIGISYARNITDRFSIGGTVKYIEQNVWHEKAWTAAADLGLLFITQFRDLRIAATIRNFGGEMQLQGRDLRQRIDIDTQSMGNNETLVAYMKTDSWPIPLSFSVGAALPVFHRDNIGITLSADAVRPTNNNEIFNIGTELRISQLFRVRAGYQSLFASNTEKGFSCGLGLKVPLLGRGIIVDYSFQEFGKFDPVQGFSLNIAL